MPVTDFFKKGNSSSQNPPPAVSDDDVMEITTSPGPSMKVQIKQPGKQRKMSLYRDIREMVDPHIDLKHKPENNMDRWALGAAFKSLQLDANKCLSSIAVVDTYDLSHDMVKEYYSVLKEKKEVANILPPPKVRLNKHNITDVQKTLLHTYRVNNMDENNPYRHLEKCLDFGFLHDATSHWVKELNTVFLRVVTGDGDIYKVPFFHEKNSRFFHWRSFM